MRLSPKGKQLVEYALTAKVWTLEKLAVESDIGISTVKKFSAGRDVNRITFVILCQKLEVDWETAIDQEPESEQTNISANDAGNSPSTPSLSNKAFFEQVRERCRQKILSQHSRMRLLSGEEIGVDQLYVDVWLLNRSPRTFQVSQDKLLQTFDLRNDRLGLGDRIKRNPGFEVANANAKLLILGKPGAGKTTFLKHLAVDWCKGQFQPDLIAIFIELRRIRDGEWQLLDAIGKELGLDEGHQIRALKRQIQQLRESITTLLEEEQEKESQIKGFQQKLEALSLQILLKEGKFLVLMDGLDEVPTIELQRNVQGQLRQIAEDYANNYLILTCRTQIIESIPNGFTSVEVSDFSPEQVQQFVQNWFRASGQSDTEAAQQWKRLYRAVSKNSAVKELTVTPVLLSLMCLVLHDEGEMPSQMTDLYRRGIRLLLEKWNNAKAIEDWEMGNDIYRKLSVAQKEALLIAIAARKFENPENFVLFEQEEIAAQIAHFLHLADYKEGVAVLKAIETQHGLLIERADELWSFSHLTFQEYFTVQWLTQLPEAQLAKTITNPQWRQVIEQLVKSQQPADHLLQLIKRAIDQSINHELEVTQFLMWVLQKAESIHAPYKPAAIRAFYFTLERARALDIVRIRAREITRTLDIDLARDLHHARALDLVCARVLALAIDSDIAINFNLDFDLDLARALYLIRTHKSIPPLANQLEQLQFSLPKDLNKFWQWWQTDGNQRVDPLMIENHSISHDWQFTEAQKPQLQRYYDANKFLVDLINIEGAITDSVRAEIEDTLLLPWDELQWRQPDVYGQTQPTSPSPVRVFIAYSQEDEDLREELDRHLANLKRQGKIQAWHKGAIEAGAEWDAAIKQQLETAQIILLLISAHFIASDHCYDLLQQSLQRHHAGTARVVPIILRPTDLKNSPFTHLSPLPTDGVPITRWSNRDEAFLNVVEGIRGAIEVRAEG